ncbi:hypothetical protein GCM10018779_57850 [Streptomyces griseocarneus]|nr:hypothetical protein GCM10018779_57850 [Streptomyces griseocarneus]
MTAKRVTSDWAAVFPGFTRWRPMRLLRRVGPVVQGICLDGSTSGKEYIPTAHVHALTRDFPVVSLTLGQRLKGTSGRPECVRFSHHESEYRLMADRLTEQSVLSLVEPPTLEEIVGNYHSVALERQSQGIPPAVVEVEDSVLLSAAAARVDLVESGLRLAEALVALWPKDRLPLDWPGASVWLDSLSARAEDVESLSAVVEGQLAKHKLSKVTAIPG